MIPPSHPIMGNSLSPIDNDATRLAVVGRYGSVAAGLTWTLVTGGLSGAAVWRGGDSGTPVLALKAWPPDGMTTDRLAHIHQLMRRSAHLPFVPLVHSTLDGETA